MCPAATDPVSVRALYGRWLVRFVADGGAGAGGAIAPARVELRAHPDYAGGVRGTVTRGGRVSQLAGDITDDEQLVMDESDDGKEISAVWAGDARAAACGKPITGIWRRADAERGQAFTMHRDGL